MSQFKSLFLALTATASTLALVGCSTNAATGKQQFTGLMSPQQEVAIGAQEHEKIVQQFGLVKDSALNAYVTDVGRRVTKDTERPDVQYKFFIIDSPIVNAFALPGGYIYVSRGLLALANNEAELASVLGHEAGHITGRHSAERYSQGVVTSLGAGVLGAVLGSQSASQALNLGTNLYLSSYSRGQENESDTLGLRYMTRGGYDPQAVPDFLYALQRQSEIEAGLDGQKNAGMNYFSTHPATAERVAKTQSEANSVGVRGVLNKTRHLSAINGMVYGDSADQGFTKGNTFYHPQMDFKFTVPNGFRIKNQPSQVLATSQSGAVIIFDAASNKGGQDAATYLQHVWMKDAPKGPIDKMQVNGRRGATLAFEGAVNGQPMTIRLVAIEWGDRFARFQIAIPKSASATMVDDLKRTTYSFDNLTAQDKSSVKPMRVALYTAKSGDTVASIAKYFPFDSMQQERFRVLNGLKSGENVKAGEVYKIITH